MSIVLVSPDKSWKRKKKENSVRQINMKKIEDKYNINVKKYIKNKYTSVQKFGGGKKYYYKFSQVFLF